MLDHNELNKAKRRIKDDFTVNKKVGLEDINLNNIRNEIPQLRLPGRSKDMSAKPSSRKKISERLSEIDESDKLREINNAYVREHEEIENERLRFEETRQEEGHKAQLLHLINSGELGRIRHRTLIVPARTSLADSLGQSFTEILNRTERENKKKDKSSELYQKSQNAKKIRKAADKYKRDCALSMEKTMEGKLVQFENREDYNDISRFITAKGSGFTADDKNELIERYIGKAYGDDVGISRKDRQLAMDLMVKSLMAVDLRRVSLDRDIDLVENAGTLESITGRVAAFDRQLEKYGEDRYYGSLNGEVANSVKRRVNYLRLVAQYYIIMRDVMADRYYQDHLASEMSLENVGPEFKEDLHGKLKQADKIRRLLFGNDAVEINFNIKANLRDNLNRSVYLDDHEGLHSAKAFKSSDVFSGLLGSFSELEQNRRMFGFNSNIMSLVKEHIADVNRVLNVNCSAYNGSSKVVLTGALKKLSRCCEDYHQIYLHKTFTKRHQNVLDIKDYADRCCDFINSINEERFQQFLSENAGTSLVQVLQSSSLIADYDKDEMSRMELRQLYATHNEVVSRIDIGDEEDHDLSIELSVDERLLSYLSDDVSEDSNAFYQSKNGIISALNSMKRLAKHDSSRVGFFMSSARDYDRNRERYEYAEKMLKVVKGIKYRNFKNRNVKGITWKELIFGEDYVDIQQGNDQQIVFSTDEQHKKLQKVTRAIDFIGGDVSMFTNYKKARRTREDGSKEYGICYSVSDGANKLISAAQVKNIAEEKGVSIVYSENALRQLTVIRFMDTLFGRTQRKLDSIKYNVKNQLVFEESTLVIQSVVTDDFDYFSQVQPLQGQGVKRSSVLGRNGKLRLNAYDRKVADEIISRTPEECLQKFKDLGIAVSDEQAEAFTDRFNTLKQALIKDRDEKTGWRNLIDQEDEKRRIKKLKSVKGELRQYRRWNVVYNKSLLLDAEYKRKDLEKKRVRNKDGMFTEALEDVLELNGNIGIVDESLLPEIRTVERDRELEDEVPVLQGTEREKRVSKARIKILKFRRDKKKFQSKSGNISAAYKKTIKVEAQNYLNDINSMVRRGVTSAESVAQLVGILTTFIAYADWNISPVGFKPKDNYAEWFTSARHTQEGVILKMALEQAGSRKTQIGENPQNEIHKLERKILSDLIERCVTIIKGTLDVPPGAAKYVADESFHDATVDPVSNTIEDHGAYKMIDRSSEPLFSHAPCVNDIAQGRVGNCYFLATMAAICERDPDFIRGMLKDNDNGTVTVRFYDKGRPVYYTVKKTIPQDTDKGSITRGIEKFAKGALWIQMVEKAFVASGLAAKAKKLTNEDASFSEQDQLAVINTLKRSNMVSYTTIETGNASDLSEYITGKKGFYTGSTKERRADPQTGKMLPVITQDQEAFWNLAKENANKNVVMVAGSLQSYNAGSGTGLDTKDIRKKGVVTKHSYTVMGVIEMAGEERIVLRNPWGLGGAEEVYDEKTGAITTKYSEIENGPYLFLNKETFFGLFETFNVVKIRSNNVQH